MTGSHPLISLPVRSPGANEAESTHSDEQNSHPGQHPDHTDEVSRGRGKEDRDERDHARDCEEGCVDPRSDVLVRSLL